MKRKILWTMLVLAGLVVIAGVMLLRPPSERPLEVLQEGDVERGAYLARAGDCVACHSAPDGKPYAGGLAMISPIGIIYSTNITPDPETGIGAYNVQDFQRAVRQGVAKAGYPLYPAMPYPSFSRMSDRDVVDLYAYFMQAVQPVKQANQATGIVWPLNMRWPLFGWITLFTDGQSYQPDPSKDAIWNRGAYLVQGLGHCGSCHTPRAFTMQEKALDQNSPDYLAGGALEGWHAPALSRMPPQVMANWSQQDLVAFMKSGRSTHSAVFGSMTDTVVNSLQHLSDDDLAAIATYLASLNPGMKGVHDALTDPVAPDATTVALRRGDLSTPGAASYVNNCAACHRTDGLGYPRTFPRLVGNSTVLNGDPATLIRIVLNGSAMPSTASAPSALTMPDFAWRLKDDELAQMLTFVRSSWGNDAGTVSPEQVAKVRKDWGPKATK